MITIQELIAQLPPDSQKRIEEMTKALIAEEKMWAAAHAVMALSQQRGWNYGDHRSLRVAVRRISEEQDDPLLEAAFSVAEKFHANFYHKFMQDYEFERDRPAVHHFVQRIQSLMTSG